MNARNLIAPLAFIFSITLLSGCATATMQEVETADFGPYPVGYEDSIKNLESQVLKDPYSAVYNFGIPRKGVSRDGLLFGGKKHFGWIVLVGINAKNSFGGYVGEQTTCFFISEGRVTDVTAMMGQMVNFVPDAEPRQFIQSTNSDWGKISNSSSNAPSTTLPPELQRKLDDSSKQADEEIKKLFPQ
jgi:hypothetical protein